MDGDAALLALRSTGYGLPLLDLGPPNRDGLAVLASLRRRDETLPAIDAGDGARIDVCARNDGTTPALESPATAPASRKPNARTDGRASIAAKARRPRRRRAMGSACRS